MWESDLTEEWNRVWESELTEEWNRVWESDITEERNVNVHLIWCMRTPHEGGEL